ncbi:hypothetical protein N7468_005804 [Penicillium chermesinum]|uniref:Calcineurin-like phosphoesterase domain-containing protein n=1 Tax=Penicillium chermesinum TaxID=63820 RepID=A0A9W9P001_9EURO|nr:uncharacterized protein N7468_005804 [Penicillium chermesinum]KAJ5232848.1 hypothetical protein N7468_005804 [Penicillium chermesinum]
MDPIASPFRSDVGVIKTPSDSLPELRSEPPSILTTVCIQRPLRRFGLEFFFQPPPEPLTPLKFAQDGTFQISILEDLHFGENAWDAWGPANDAKSVGVIDKIFNAETPDLVVLNGDLITGDNTFLENSTLYVDQIVGPLLDRGLSWASTYGNHDSHYNLSREALLAREQQWTNCRTQQHVFGAQAGVSNYFLPVYGSGDDKQEHAPELILWFFDSRGGSYFQQLNSDGKLVAQPNWVDVSVVDWFKEANARLVEKWRRNIPSLAFVHLPTNASLAAQDQVGIDPHLQPGLNDDYLLAGQGRYWCPDQRYSSSCGYSGEDVPFMQALVETPGMMGLFSGHDHGNTWCYKWDSQIPGMELKGNGMHICFGQHTGYGGYGDWIRGSRQILVRESDLEEGILETWIRLESDNIVGAVTLNATYGEDTYPQTPNQKTSGT